MKTQIEMENRNKEYIETIKVTYSAIYINNLMISPVLPGGPRWSLENGIFHFISPHSSTFIQSMTPRSGRNCRRSRRVIPMLSLNTSYIATSPNSEDVSRAATPAAESVKGVEEETIPSEEGEEVENEAEEQRLLIESQGTRIEELTQQIQVLI